MNVVHLRPMRMFIAENSLDCNEAIMIPDYCTFIRHQDKRLIPYLYLVTLILLGLYWKNSGYTLASNHAWSISAVLSLILFSFTSELKNYWAYKCVVRNIDCSFFDGKSASRYEILFSRPVVVLIFGWLLFYLLVKISLQFLLPTYALLCIALVSPFLSYLVYRWIRHSVMKHMSKAVAEKIKYRNLHRYLCANLVIIFMMSVLIVGPLRLHEDFSLSEGYFSARLMVAMLILCVIVLAINLVFIRPSRRYIFLGRLFMKEVDFTLSSTIPYSSLYNKPLWVRLIILLIIQSVWIVATSIILSLTGWTVYFEIFFVLCLLPSMGYFYLHVYWLWHNDFMMACDMYLRCDGIDKKNRLW